MAAPSKSEMEDLIRVAFGQAVDNIKQIFGYLLGERVFRQQAEGALNMVVNEAPAEFTESSARIDRLCTDYNAQFD